LFQLKVILPTPIVPIDPSAGIIVYLCSLGLWNHPLNSLWRSIQLVVDLLPAVSGVRTSWLKGQSARYEIAPVSIHPAEGKHGWSTVFIPCYQSSPLTSLSYLQGQKVRLWKVPSCGLDDSNESQSNLFQFL
jgi:hypothetical protein